MGRPRKDRSSDCPFGCGSLVIPGVEGKWECGSYPVLGGDTRRSDRCRVLELRALLLKWIDRFGDYEDAGPRGETWQSDELASLIEVSESAAKGGA